MNRENYTDAMINAETAFSNKNYALALEWFHKALEEDPDDLQALSRAGTVCALLDKFDESFEYFKRALELDPENGDNAFNLGNAYFFHGDHGKALELYAEAEMKGCSENAKPRLYYQMALLCSVRKDVKSALTNLQKYEDADKSGTASIDPDVISEKIKLYMMAEDHENAAKCAVQWITVAPTELRSYMVYFSILMAKHDYDTAEKILNDAEKYAELDDATRSALKVERATLLVAKSDTDPENSASHLQEAYDLVNSIIENAPVQQKNELTLTLAEICMKMGRYREAIDTASSLIPADNVKRFDIKHSGPVYEELDEAEIEAMVEEDMQSVNDKIVSGEIDENAGEYAEVYYDENGDPVREYPEGMFDGTVGPAREEIRFVGQPSQEATERPGADYYDRLYFVLLSCYVAVEDHTNVHKFGGLLKHSENVYYSYFGRYAEAFSVKKLSDTSTGFTKEDAEKVYAETISFFRSKMLQDPNNNFAVIFRARMYAESGKFAKAEEMADLLALDEKEAVMSYIDECRKEYQSM